MFYIMVFHVLQGDYEAALKIYDEQVSGLKLAYRCVCTGKSTDVLSFVVCVHVCLWRREL